LHPELDGPDSEVKSGLARLADGLLNLAFSTLLYSFFLWFLTRTLQQADVISFRFTWVQCTGMVGLALFCRVWDRAFLRP